MPQPPSVPPPLRLRHRTGMFPPPCPLPPASLSGESWCFLGHQHQGEASTAASFLTPWPAHYLSKPQVPLALLKTRGEKQRGAICRGPPYNCTPPPVPVASLSLTSSPLAMIFLWVRASLSVVPSTPRSCQGWSRHNKGWVLSSQRPSRALTRQAHPGQVFELVFSSNLSIAVLISSKVDIAQMQDAGHDA